ncbi:GNAT family N-acetyltransferase [Psychromicrobium lacuslunae]|uniref:GNAT family acetyltraansferase n=1 Tax=Psychromicrobium lacuslunae TaxID=1618207 RepID=A0A0D4C0J8_9MICC|nr:GNAT family N-acetyltransferase [Psychromicrobium lacuslunae]AJT42197.1 GNAT family acetyltraansferase [Psychromicrobium lacuslunae]
MTATPENAANSTDEPSVVRNDEAGRYEIYLGEKLAGFTIFLDTDQQRIFPHTVIDEEFSGHGLSSILVRQALADTQAAKRRIVAVRPVVARYLQKHPELQDSVDPVTPEVISLLRSLS